MNKSELISAVSEKAGMTKKTTDTAIMALLEVIKETMEKGEKIAIPGLGTFEVRERAARNGRNPRTDETTHIPARKTPALKFSKVVKDSLNP